MIYAWTVILTRDSVSDSDLTIHGIAETGAIAERLAIDRAKEMVGPYSWRVMQMWCAGPIQFGSMP